MISHNLPNLFYNALKSPLAYRITNTQDSTGATFDILSDTAEVVNRVEMTPTKLTCTCLSRSHSADELCKHILYLVVRHFAIVKNDLADLITLRELDWNFIENHRQDTVSN